MTRKIVCAYAFAYCKEKWERITLQLSIWTGHGLVEQFLETPSKAIFAAQNANKQVILEYFELLEKSLFESGIKDKPDSIYNCDETGTVLDSTYDSPCTLDQRMHCIPSLCLVMDGELYLLWFEKSHPQVLLSGQDTGTNHT